MGAPVALGMKLACCQTQGIGHSTYLNPLVQHVERLHASFCIHVKNQLPYSVLDLRNICSLLSMHMHPRCICMRMVSPKTKCPAHHGQAARKSPPALKEHEPHGQNASYAEADQGYRATGSGYTSGEPQHAYLSPRVTVVNLSKDHLQAGTQVCPSL